MERFGTVQSFEIFFWFNLSLFFIILLKDFIFFRVGIFGAIFEYGCNKKITQFSDLGGSITIGSLVGVTLKMK